MRIAVYVLLSMIALLSVSASAFEESDFSNYRNYRAPDVHKLKARAAKGDPEAQYKLGLEYLNGSAVQKNDDEAAALWFRKAADQGIASAQFQLALMYENGRGVPQDYVEAVRWYRKAAGLGDEGAQNNLGVKYEKGLGVPQDDVEAVRWYRKAADQGSATAQNNLGRMYEQGRGIPQDDAEAVRWYRKAADQGNANAQMLLGLGYEAGLGVPQDDGEAMRWFREAADQNKATGQYMLGRMYEEGRGVERNLPVAANWYSRAADRLDYSKDALLRLKALGILPKPSVDGVDHWSKVEQCQAAEWAAYYVPSIHRKHEIAEVVAITEHPSGGCFELDLPDRVGGRGWVRLPKGTKFVYARSGLNVVLRLAESNNRVYSEVPFAPKPYSGYPAPAPDTLAGAPPIKFDVVRGNTPPVSDTDEDQSFVREKWAIVVGISHFKNPSMNLRYAAKDATDFADMLKDPTVGRFRDDGQHVRLLTDEQATVEGIRTAINDIAKNARKKDLVIVYFSSHGTSASSDVATDEGKSGYIVAYNTDPQNLYATAFPMDELKRVVETRIKAARVVAFMDTCYSGGFYGPSGGKAMQVGILNDSMFQLAQGKGRVMIASSRDSEQSWESDTYQNSYFTHYLINAMKSRDGLLTITQLFTDLQRNVPQAVQLDKKAQQNPVMAPEGRNVSIVIGAAAIE